MERISVLSTRNLSSKNNQAFLNAEITLLEHDFIKIETLSFQLKSKPDLLLFTSQNAVKSVLENAEVTNLKNIPVICVGSITRKLLENSGFKVLETKEYASELAPIIQEKYANSHIAFFAGNLRRHVLPTAMQEANITYDEYLVYQNTENSTKINNNIQAILFYSPSGVNSYLKQNTISNQICFCIGTTTAEALTEITQNIVISNQQTIEAVVLQCINYFRK